MRKILDTAYYGNLTLADKMNIKNGSAVEQLNDMVSTVEPSAIIGQVKGYAVLKCRGTDDDGKEIEYEQVVIVTYNGKFYGTLSPVFKDAFENMFNELDNATDEEKNTIVFKVLQGENDKGQKFLTCAVEEVTPPTKETKSE